MTPRRCPIWAGHLLASPIRRLFQDPQKLLSPWVKEGMTVLEPGPGMGFFTLDLARLVGKNGRVVAVDVQLDMLEGLARRARRAGVRDQIELREAKTDRLGTDDLRGRIDFIFAFAVVHELPDAAGFFAEAHAALAPAGRILFAEPRGHVSDAAFAAGINAAERAGFRVESRPVVRRHHAALLVC